MKTQIRKGYTKVHSAPKEVQNKIMSLRSQGYTYKAIGEILIRDHGYSVGHKSLKKYIDIREDDIGDMVYESEVHNKRVLDDFYNVLQGLNHVHKRLLDKFDKAMDEENFTAAGQCAKLIKDNIETAHKIVSDMKKEQAKSPKDEKKSFGQLIELVVPENYRDIKKAIPK